MPAAINVEKVPLARRLSRLLRLKESVTRAEGARKEALLAEISAIEHSIKEEKALLDAVFAAPAEPGSNP